MCHSETKEAEVAVQSGRTAGRIELTERRAITLLFKQLPLLSPGAAEMGR